MRYSNALACIPVEVQADKYDGYIRVTFKGVSVLEGQRITPENLAQLLVEIGFTVELCHGVFGGEEDDQYEKDGTPIFVCEEKVIENVPQYNQSMEMFVVID